MKSKDLKAKSVDELLSLRSRITSIIAAKQRQMAAARQRVLALAKRCGVSLRDLGLKSGRGPDKAPRKTRAKHVNPKAPEQTWNGKGRPPNWYKAIKTNGTGSHAVN